MATFNQVAAFKSLLQRKALVGAVLIADYSDAALSDICTTGGALAPLTGYKSLGKLTSDGVSLPNDIERQEQRGWGDTSSPSRIDIVSESSSMSFTAMETNKVIIDAFYNVDQDAIVPKSTGTITFDKPPLPQLRDKRLVGIFRDVNKNNDLDVYFGVHYPKCNVSQNGEQSLANNEAGLVYPLMAQALVDDPEGTAVRLFWGGAGLSGLLADMGYPQPAPTV